MPRRSRSVSPASYRYWMVRFPALYSNCRSAPEYPWFAPATKQVRSKGAVNLDTVISELVSNDAKR